MNPGKLVFRTLILSWFAFLLRELSSENSQDYLVGRRPEFLPWATRPEAVTEPASGSPSGQLFPVRLPVLSTALGQSGSALGGKDLGGKKHKACWAPGLTTLPTVPEGAAWYEMWELI